MFSFWRPVKDFSSKVVRRCFYLWASFQVDLHLSGLPQCRQNPPRRSPCSQGQGRHQSLSYGDERRTHERGISASGWEQALSSRTKSGARVPGTGSRPAPLIEKFPRRESVFLFLAEMIPQLKSRAAKSGLENVPSETAAKKKPKKK